MNILVTGAAGFIGRHLSMRLLDLGHNVSGLDRLYLSSSNSYNWERSYDLRTNNHFNAVWLDVKDIATINDQVFYHRDPEVMFHLAADTGVRGSIKDPTRYFDNNVKNFQHVLEFCRLNGVKHLIYASSSSVYGSVDKPSKEKDTTDYPVSIYAATKKAMEVMAQAYATNYGMKITGVRFFTVYGPWGRQDMAPWLFTSAIVNEKPLTLYGDGTMYRDFTYVDSIVDCLTKLMDRQGPPHDVFNIGGEKSIQVIELVRLLENIIGKEAKIINAPVPAGDVPFTGANMSKFRKLISPQYSRTSLEDGMVKFVTWFYGYKKSLQNSRNMII